ncbi:hypothetical protein GPECTOR_14g80 [Gonium pectorale]|uniref:Uncharacterized protein n=1 Tax=Gonium pectorale TaxID=33097 RepID=A0A150GMU6_GONPE|nr:hypothetical protein GPECTOR_14g80 [Gonium pectorale]|eukprot:KXZ51098.1 hypothetical protein GPECTOR_14g80 [Gonium pectorale]
MRPWLTRKLQRPYAPGGSSRTLLQCRARLSLPPALFLVQLLPALLLLLQSARTTASTVPRDDLSAASGAEAVARRLEPQNDDTYARSAEAPPLDRRIPFSLCDALTGLDYGYGYGLEEADEEACWALVPADVAHPQGRRRRRPQIKHRSGLTTSEFETRIDLFPSVTNDATGTARVALAAGPFAGYEGVLQREIESGNGGGFDATDPITFTATYNFRTVTDTLISRLALPGYAASERATAADTRPNVAFGISSVILGG